ncbi:MAG: hypothetical protein DMG37_16100 [Acidobacteria bacterium]|nr:MAG: hypothetical protein DMG37_16100 [Acidobacteriota bacterium]
MKPLYKRSLLVAVRNLLQRIPFKPVDINCLHFLEYTGIPHLGTALPRTNCAVRRASLKDLPGMTECQRTPEVFLKRFEMKDHCAVAIIESRIVGYEWFCEKPSHLEERYAYKIEIPPDAIYAYDAFILPEHRLSGIWVRFKTTYLRKLMETLSKRKIIAMIDRGNYLSMNTHLRFGFRPIRTVFVCKLFGKSFFINRNAHNNKFPFSFRASFADALGRAEQKESWPSKSATC